MMLACTMAGIAFGHADVAAVHCIAEAIGGKYHIAHGAAIAMFLPEVIRFNAETAPKKYEEIVELLGLSVFIFVRCMKQ